LSEGDSNMKIALSFSHGSFPGAEKTISTEWDVDDASFALTPEDRKAEYLSSEVGAAAEGMWIVIERDLPADSALRATYSEHLRTDGGKR
jgi:hypothetical protein